MKESHLGKLIHLALSTAGLKIFRQNTGQAWAGQLVSKTQSQVVLRDPRPLHAGLCNGSSDYIGWKPVIVTAEMVGKPVAIFAAIEVKSEAGRLTNEQKAFLKAVEADGGIALIARTPDEAANLMALWLSQVQAGTPSAKPRGE